MAGLARALPGVARAPSAPESAQPNLALQALEGVNRAATAPLTMLGVDLPAFRDQVTGYRNARLNDNFRQDAVAREEAYDELIDDIWKRRGVRLDNPIRARLRDPLSAPYLQDAYGAPQNDPVAQFEQQVANLARGRGDFGDLLERSTSDAVQRRAGEMQSRARTDFDRFIGDGGEWARLGRGLLLTPGLIAGAISSGSPEQVAQLAAGGAGKGLSLMERLLSGAGANIVGQAATEPAAMEAAARDGHPMGAGDVARDFVLAGVLGATVEGAPELARGRPRLRELARERVTLPDVEPAPRATEPLPADIPLEGTPAALATQAEPRDRATVAAIPEDATTEQLVEAINQNDDFMRGDWDAFPAQAEPERRAPVEEVEAAARQADDAPAPREGTRERVTMNGVTRPRTFERFTPESLGFDPDRFQFKRSEGAQGSTGRLAGVEAWDSQSAGKIVVFEAADGRLYVADGHQRVALAQALQARGERGIALDGYRYREKDGWTAREVRNLAAQKNLRETVGDPIDAAMLMRDAPNLIDSSVPQRGADFRVARGLAKLSDEGFAAVRSGVIDPRLGAVIGETAAARPEIHSALVDLFRRDPPANNREAAYIVQEAMQASVHRAHAAQLSLFGDATELSGMRERAEILNAAGAILRDDKRVFSVAERNADALEAAGNVLASETNARRAELAEALLREIDRLATRPGPVADILRDVSTHAAANKTSAKDAAREFVDRVAEALEAHGLEGLKTGAPLVTPPPAHVRREPAQVEAEARAATLRDGHNRDAEALRQSAAEVALDRAQAGEQPAPIPEDAIGHTPEADLSRIEDAAAAMEAVGAPVDRTKLEAGAQILARGGEELERDARARLAPATEMDAQKAEVFARGGADVPANEIPPDAISSEGIAHPKVDGAAVQAQLAQADEVVKTSWGAELRARAGQDFILTDDKGDRWVVRADLFNATYEPAGDGHFRKSPSQVAGFWISPDERVIHTLEGPVTAHPGDYVMVGAIGEMWPVKPERFAQRYEEIKSAPSPEMRIDQVMRDGYDKTGISGAIEALNAIPDVKDRIATVNGLRARIDVDSDYLAIVRGMDGVKKATPAREAPDTFAHAAEMGDAIEAPFALADMKDEKALRTAASRATLPELEAARRAENIGADLRTRAEYEAAFLRDWKSRATSDEDQVFYRSATHPPDATKGPNRAVFFATTRKYAAEFPRGGAEAKRAAQMYRARIDTSKFADLGREADRNAVIEAAGEKSTYVREQIARHLRDTRTGRVEWLASADSDIRDAAQAAGFRGMWLDDWGNESVAVFDNAAIADVVTEQPSYRDQLFSEVEQLERDIDTLKDC